jgi:TolB-like protein/class 3 adenylate cyclase/Tfp pilus assembly protein PilF
MARDEDVILDRTPLNDLAKMAATRRLAAILAADVVGYSRLIGSDEQGTLARLKMIRAELIDPSIAAHGGRIVKTTGDGLLAEFGSSVDALRCALETQAGLRERNAGLAPNSRIELRLGIHQGDIVVEEGDIFGDGVNIAARLEGLADPGGICVSARVQEDAAGKLDVAFRDLGEQQLKNIARPVRTYAVGAERHFSASGKPADPVPLISLVVLPFTNLSPDPEQEYFVDAITDDLTTDLSRITNSFVIARSTAFTYKGKAVDVRQVSRELGVRYVLEGSVRRVGDRIQVNVQLIDGLTGSHVWADRFDTDHRDLAEAQSHITARLARTLYFELVKDVGRRIEQEHAAHPDPRDLVMRARALWIQTSPSDTRARAGIIDLLEGALILDPASVDAGVVIASILVSDIADGLSSAVEQDEARAERLISEALERNPNHSEGRRVMGHLRRVQGRWAESQVELETAIALDPNDSAAIRQLGLTLLLQGKPEAAISHFERAIHLEVRHRYMFNGYANLGRCQLFLGRIDEAVESFRRARTLAPGIWYVHLELAAALGLRGDIEEAQSEITEVLKIKREMSSVAQWRAIAVTQGFGHAQFQALREKTSYAGLRRAGFPEE